MSRVALYRQMYQGFPTSHGCETVTTGVIFHRSVCFSFFERLLSQTVGEAPQAWARPSSKPNPIPDLVMWVFGPWVLHYSQISPGQVTISISGGTDVWPSQKQWWMLRKFFFWVSSLVGSWKSNFHVLMFTALRLWLWQCGGEKCSQSVAKQRSWSRLSCWAVPGLCCVFVLRNTAKKIRRARPAYKLMILNYSQWTRSTPNASLLWLASWARYCQLDRSTSLWQTYEVCVWRSAPNTSNNNGYTFVSRKNHGHIFRPEIKLAWPEQNMTCFVGELAFHNRLLQGQFKFEFKSLRSTKPIHVCW